MEISKDLDILKGNTPLEYHHPIHLGIQAYFMVTTMHVLTMDIELEIAGNIT